MGSGLNTVRLVTEREALARVQRRRVECVRGRCTQYPSGFAAVERRIRRVASFDLTRAVALAGVHTVQPSGRVEQLIEPAPPCAWAPWGGKPRSGAARVEPGARVE